MVVRVKNEWHTPLLTAHGSIALIYIKSIIAVWTEEKYLEEMVRRELITLVKTQEQGN